MQRDSTRPPQSAHRAVLGPLEDFSGSRGVSPHSWSGISHRSRRGEKIFHAGGRAVIRARSQNFPDLGGGGCTAEPCRAHVARIRSHTPAPKHPGRLAFHFYTFSLCFWAVLQPVFGHDKAAPTHMCVTAARGHEVFSLVLDPPDTGRNGIFAFLRRGVWRCCMVSLHPEGLAGQGISLNFSASPRTYTMVTSPVDWTCSSRSPSANFPINGPLKSPGFHRHKVLGVSAVRQ